MTEKISVVAVVAIVGQPDNDGLFLSYEVANEFVKRYPERYWIDGNRLMARLDVVDELIIGENLLGMVGYGYTCSENLA